jgi:uncharacterized protein (TIGR02265 family)
MPDVEQQLAVRLAAATPRDRVRGVLFNAAFELVTERAGSAAAAACDPLGKGVRREFFTSPVADYLGVVWAAAGVLAAGAGGRGGALHALGDRAARRWLASSPGQTLVAFAGRDPRSLVANAPTGYRSVVTYGTRTVEWIDERRARLHLEREFLPAAFHCGVLAALLEATCGLAPATEGRDTGPLEAECVVAW